MSILIRIGWMRLSIIALIYGATLCLDRWWVMPVGHLIPVQFAGGVALAILLTTPRSQWRATNATLLVVALLLGCGADEFCWLNLGLVLLDLLVPMVGAWLFWRVQPVVTMNRVADVLRLLLVALFVNALFSTPAAWLMVNMTGQILGEAWLTIWLANGLGILLGTPFILVWAEAWHEPRRTSAGRYVEAVAFCLVLGLITWSLLIDLAPNARIMIVTYLIIPLHVWAILRFGPRGAATSLGLINTVMLWNARNGVGFFAVVGQSPSLILLTAQILVLIGAGSLVFAAIGAERIQIEAALRVSEARFRRAFENANIGMCLIDLDGRLIQVNHYLAAMLDYTPAELTQLTVDDITHADYRTTPPVFSRATGAQAEDDQAYEKMYVSQHGDFLWGKVSSVTVRDEHGMPLYFIAHIQDITAQKQAQEQLRQLSRAVEYSPASIIITDTQGNIEYVNPKFVELTGYALEEARGQNPRLLKSGEMPREAYQEMWSMITAGKVWRGEFHNKKKNGELYWEYASISPIIDPTGKITHFVAVKEDITARKQTEEQLLYIGTHDGLTGLYNRLFFQAELHRLSPSRQFPVSVVMIDLDGLKQINDLQGHAAGDALIVRAAQLLKQSFRVEDVVARIGGDEFAVLLPATNRQTLTQVLERVRHILTEENHATPNLPLMFSLGAATADKGSLLETFKIADARMYADKREHKTGASVPKEN